MKKIFLVFFLFLLFFAPVLANAACNNCTPKQYCCNNSCQNDPCLVPCTGPDCTICSFFQMLANVYNFIVWNIASPLAIIALIVGGIFMLISAGNPTLLGKGKQILWAAIIGLALVFASWVIINGILDILGYNLGSWWNPNFNCT